MDAVRRQLVLCDRTYANPGVRVYDTATHECLTPQPIAVGLYPHWLLAVPGPNSSVPEGGPRATTWLWASPQPSRDHVTLRLAGPGAWPEELYIHDASGRRVAVLRPGTWAHDSRVAQWDGRDLDVLTARPGTHLLDEIRRLSPESCSTEALSLEDVFVATLT